MNKKKKKKLGLNNNSIHLTGCTWAQTSFVMADSSWMGSIIWGLAKGGKENSPAFSAGDGYFNCSRVSRSLHSLMALHLVSCSLDSAVNGEPAAALGFSDCCCSCQPGIVIMATTKCKIKRIERGWLCQERTTQPDWGHTSLFMYHVMNGTSLARLDRFSPCTLQVI